MVDDTQYRLLTSYAINTSVARFRAREISSSELESKTCQALVHGCGKSTGLGHSIYSSFVSNATGLDTLGGFGNSLGFSQIESTIKTDYLSSYSSDIQDKYGVISAGVLLGGYATNLDVSELQTYFSGVFDTMATFYNGPTGAFFSTTQLTTLQSTLNLGGTLTEIYTLSPKDFKTNKIYFQTYDLSDSFSTDLDLHKFKDAGMQYYSVSGELNYEGTHWDDTPDCVEIEVPVFLNNDVEMVSQYYYVGPQSFPCIDRHSTVRPVTGVEFERTFVDGPYSTGDWTQEIVANEYISREKSRSNLQTLHYESNIKTPSLFLGDPISSPIASMPSTVLELPHGEFYEPFDVEEKTSPANGQKTWFHVGNATGVRTGREIQSYQRNPLNNWQLLETYRDNPKASTGVKFIPLKLKQSSWGDSLASTLSNPLLGSGRILQTAMNFHQGHSIDINSTRITNGLSGIAGPPQRDDLSDLPFITVTQDFQSKTNGTYPSIMLGYGLSNSERYFTNGWHLQTFMSYTSGSGAFSTKFEDQNYREPDELIQPNVPFQYSIFNREVENLQLEGQSIRAHVMGFGNNLDGGKAEDTYKIQNGGYVHSGRIHSGVEFATGEKSLLHNLILVSGYSGTATNRIASGFGPISLGNTAYGSILSDGCVVGSREYYDEYIYAWKHPTYGKVSTSLMYMYYTGSTGVEEFRYNAFDSGRTVTDVPQFPAISPLTFAQNGTVTGLVGSGWIPLKRRQRKENFFPRYYRGPYASARRKFLYPHAQDMLGYSAFGTITSGLSTPSNQGSMDFYDWSGKQIQLVEYGSGGFSEKVGFPHFIVFDLEVKEYATKEFYKKTDWNEFGNPVQGDYSINGISPNLPDITWDTSTDYAFSETDSVDGGFAGPRLVTTYSNGYYQDIFMGFTGGVNPLVYNSPPNFVQGFINDREGNLSGSVAGGGPNVGEANWPYELKPDSGAFIVRWKEGLSGSSVGPFKHKNPEGNYTLYKAHKRTVTGIYTPPGYRLSDNKFNPEFARRIWGTGNIEAIEGGGRVAGVDPLYYKRVSSSTGLEGTTLNENDHGGFHPNGLGGDSWMVFSPSGFTLGGEGEEAYYAGGGVGSRAYGYGKGKQNPGTRLPEQDYGIILLDMRSTGFGFHFRGLDYFPNSGRQEVSEVNDLADFFKSGVYTGYGQGGSPATFGFAEETYTYLGTMQTGELYSKPVYSDGRPWPGWTGTLTGSSEVWPDIKEMQKSHTGALRNWRSQSKVELTFSNVQFSGHGQLPYDEEHLYTPSGGCSIEGAMTYKHMAEAPVFSEGILLEDTSRNDPVLTRGNYSNFISDVLKEHSVSATLPINAAIQPAPSRQLTLVNPNDSIITSPSDFGLLNTLEKDYNKYTVFARSDYATLNAGTMPSYEGRPVADDRVFPKAEMMFSANRGQRFQDNTTNPTVKKQYTVKDQRQYYEGELTDALEDERFMTQIITRDLYEDPANGRFIPANVTLREGEKGLY
jgi:hypothetical protein